MANQYTVNTYSDQEINEILSLYNSGISYSAISHKFQRKKANIRKILIENNVWIENRNNVKVIFTQEEKNNIIDLYVNHKNGSHEISKIFGVSRTVIKRILIENKLLRNGYSNGVKIVITKVHEELIKHLYLNQYLNVKQISVIVGLSSSYVDKYLNSTGYRRTKSEGTSIGLVKRFSGLNYDEYLKKLPEYVKYKRNVLRITNCQPISSLDYFNKRGVSGIDGAYHLDHKYSILEGFKNNISFEKIGNIKNLIFIPWKDNLTKRTKCSISKEEIINY